MVLPSISKMNATLSKTRSSNFTCKVTRVNASKKVDFYKVLSLDSRNVGVDEIKSAYRSMALRYHPDVCHDPTKREESTRMFIELQKAYEMLTDPIERKKYDYRLHLSDLGYDEGEEGGRWEERDRFPKEVWMNQLDGLDAWSDKRMARKRGCCV